MPESWMYKTSMDLKEQSRRRLFCGGLGLALLLMMSVGVSRCGCAEEGGVNQKDQATESWTDWAKDKISERLRLKGSEDSLNSAAAPDKASESAKAAKDKVQDVASGSIYNTS